MSPQSEASFSSMLLILNMVGESFGVQNPSLLNWPVAGFSLTAGTFLIFSGRLGDVFGYKLMLLIGFSWFSLWSLVAGLAIYSGYTLFIVARVSQGIGSAICIPNALAILGAAYPAGHRKAMVFALFGAMAPVGAMTGTICATAISLLWWPWVYFASTIALALLAVVTHFIVPSIQSRKLGQKLTLENLAVKLDLVGAATGVSALILFSFAWNQAPIVGWDAPQVIATLISGVALFWAFVWIELHHAEHPLLPLDAFNSDVAFVLAALACGWSMFGIWVYYVVAWLENVRHLSPILTVVWLMPILVTGALASVITGVLLGPAGFRPATVMAMAMAFFTAGMALFATVPVDQVYWAQTFLSTAILPFGMDMSFPAATLILSNAVKKEHQGIAASLVSTIVNYSTSLGLGFAGTLEVHVRNGGKTEADLVRGYRSALYMAVGLAAFGLVISLIYVVRDRLRMSRISSEEETESTEP